MNTAVGMDVSKGKSVVAAMRPFGEVALPPREFLHTSEGLSALSEALRLSDGSTRVILCTFYHRDCVSSVSVAAFSGGYNEWCKRKGYNFSTAKAAEIYAVSRDMVVTMPKNALTKALITSAANQLIAATAAPATLKAEFIRLAATLPEYVVVRSMYGVGEVTGAQLMAEIGDVRRFANRGALIAFAGVDPGVNESGKHSSQSVRTTKRGSPHLRKTLFQIVSTHLKQSPPDEPVYQFLDRKRAEGKPCLV